MFDQTDFKKAFSALHASDDTIQEVMTMTVYKKRPNRVLYIALIAAVIVLLCATTAMAAPSVYKYAIGNGEVSATVVDHWAAETPSDFHGNSQSGEAYQIRVDIAMHEDAPAEIETCYIPRIPEEYTLSFGYAYAGIDYDQLGVVYFHWDISDTEKAAIRFTQESAHTYGIDGLGVSVFLEDGTEPVLEETVLGGKEGFLVIAPDGPYGGEQFFCWSDGDYVFHMRFPDYFTLQQIDRIIGSVESVEDIRPYLVSMTDTEFEKTFAD